MSDRGLVDTRFRTALQRLDREGRLLKVRSRLDPNLEVVGLIHRLAPMDHPLGWSGNDRG